MVIEGDSCPEKPTSSAMCAMQARPHICPHCSISFTKRQALGCHMRIHKRIQPEDVREGRNVPQALRANNKSPKEKEVKKPKKQHKTTMESQTVWSQYSATNSTHHSTKELHQGIGCSKTHMQTHSPQLIDFMGMLKHGQYIGSSSANDFNNAEWREQMEKIPTLNLDITLNSHEIDLTLKL